MDPIPLAAGRRKAWVVSVLMGLGHIRAAYPLKDLGEGEVILYGSRRSTPRREYRIWKIIRKFYYFSSRAGNFPLIGQWLLKIMLSVEKISAYYPVRDLSKPNLAVRYLRRLIGKKQLCRALAERIKTLDIPIISTFYATAIAMEKFLPGSSVNYLLICDTDFNRIWVPENPRNSRIRYLAPCTQAKKRLQTYGVPEENIFLTGFPLPKENIGSETNLEILREDLFGRLLRLDPKRKFFSFHQKSVAHWLGEKTIPPQENDAFYLTFAVGGAGAQIGLIRTILKSLGEKIRNQEIKINLLAGVQRHAFETILGYINSLELAPCLGESVHLIHDLDVFRYLTKFNETLRTTDVLWTKPSELSFYCALGIPILMAPPIGMHEELNRRWLQEIHAGIEPAGPLEFSHEWLFDLRENGRLAEAAWDGFLKARKLGTYRIEDLIKTGRFEPSLHPLEK